MDKSLRVASRGNWRRSMKHTDAFWELEAQCLGLVWCKKEPNIRGESLYIRATWNPCDGMLRNVHWYLSIEYEERQCRWKLYPQLIEIQLAWFHRCSLLLNVNVTGKLKWQQVSDFFISFMWKYKYEMREIFSDELECDVRF